MIDNENSTPGEHSKLTQDEQVRLAIASMNAASGVIETGLLLTDDDEWFWTSSKELEHIRAFARARKAAPYAVLAHMLARVLAATPHQVVLPPLVGGYASLNLFVAVTGRSGTGKGAARGAALDAIKIDRPAFEIQIGSGEGIAATYVRPKPKSRDPHDISTGEIKWMRHNALFRAAEVTTLAALGERSGSTLVPELCKAYVGEALGFGYRSQETRLPVPEFEYRLCFTVDVQPAKADVFFQNEENGFLSRFLFVSTLDRGYVEGQPGPTPAPLQWSLPESLVPDEDTQYLVMYVDELIQDYVVANIDALNQSIRTPDTREGHHYLTWFKLAAAFALLHGQHGVSRIDWWRAELMMKMSERIIDDLRRIKDKRESEVNEAKAYTEAKRDEIKREAIERGMNKRVAARVLTYLQHEPGGLVFRDLRHKFGKADEKAVLEDVLIDLTNAGLIEAEPFEHNGRPAKRYRIAH